MTCKNITVTEKLEDSCVLIKNNAKEINKQIIEPKYSENYRKINLINPVKFKTQTWRHSLLPASCDTVVRKLELPWRDILRV